MILGVIVEMGVLYYSLLVWFKNPDLPESGGYTYHQRSQVKQIVTVFIILIVLETAGLHFLLQQWSEALAWISVVFNIYGILYMIALNNSFRCLPILLKDDRLIVRLGFQSRLDIPLSNIESIGQAKPVLFGEEAPKETFLAYLRVDTPQFEVRLKKPLPMKGAYGMKKSISAVILRVDNPHEFAAELNRRLERACLTK